MLKSITNLIDGQFVFIFQREQLIQSRRDQQTFRYLKQAGYLKKIDDQRYSVTLLSQINLLSELIKKRKPDGRLRIIFFDIPEKMRSKRNHFRRHLVELEFSMLQQSVWISKLPCENLVKKVVKYHGLKKYVDFVIADTVSLY